MTLEFAVVSACALTSRRRFFNPLSLCGIDVFLLFLFLFLGDLPSTPFLLLLSPLLGSHLEGSVLLTSLALLPELIACVPFLVSIEGLLCLAL